MSAVSASTDFVVVGSLVNGGRTKEIEAQRYRTCLIGYIDIMFCDPSLEIRKGLMLSYLYDSSEIDLAFA